MDKNDPSSMREEALLSEESDKAILAILQSLNKNMTEMGASLRSLKEKGETQTPTTAEPATKRKSLSTGDSSDTEELDADALLAANKRPKVVADKSNGSTCETSADDESYSLLTQSLSDTEKNCSKSV